MIFICTNLLPKEVDPDFMSSVLSSLPGVDPNDPRIKDALNNMSEKKNDKADKKDGK